ncbi:MAG: diguanylate cyclase [Peptostreptococcaceae bacterium]|nr:diguanylate cyclase [Peptostreptococcaceae bacterium]
MRSWLRKHFNMINYALMVLLGLVLLMFFTLKSDYVLKNQYSMQIESVNDSFIQVTSDGNFYATLPGNLDTVDGIAILKSPITSEMMNNGGIGFYSINTYVRAYLDNDLIYTNYDFDRYDQLVEIGNVWNHFEIEPWMKDHKELILELRSFSSLGYIKMGNIYAGDQQDIFISALQKDLYLYWLILVLQVAGWFVLFFRYSYRKTMAIDPSIGMLGIGAILASVAVFSFSNIVAFDFMGGYSLKLLGYSTVLLSMVAIAGYVVQNKYIEHHKVLMTLMAIDIVWAVGFVISHILFPRMFGYWSYFVFLVLFFGTLGYCIILVEDIYRKGQKKIRLLLCTLCGLFLVILLDVLLNYSTNIDGPLFSFFMTAAFFVMNSIHEVDRTSSHHEWAAQMNYFKELASTDQMTGLKNRMCFVEDIENYNERPQGLVAISFDVDNLKSVNDNYGHNVGDDMIITAGDMINYCFGKYGDCYRMSGDEFLCITEADVVVVEALLRDFRGLIQEVDEKKSYRFRVSSGIASFDESQDHAIEDTINRAEKEMYQDKRSGRSHRSY